MNNTQRVVLGIVIIAAAGLFFIPHPGSEPQVPTLQIGQARLVVEVADTPELRMQGLSGRDSMAANAGMLFIFDAPDKYRFWMRDMRFDLDFIWIAEGKVVEITSRVLSERGVLDENLPIYSPQVPVDSMLEVNSGWVLENGIQVGDSVTLKLPKSRP